MGGFGSGRYEYATTPTVEDCRTLNVNEFADAVEHPGTGATIRWGPEDNPNASIRVHLLPQSGDAEKSTALHLEYTITDSATHEKTAHDYHVPLEYTECNFGGERPWFRCPGVVNSEHCGRRIAKLYRPPRGDLFLCRHCYDLEYTSSRISGDDVKQAELQYRRAFKKADVKDRSPHPNHEPYSPDRPKGMHRETFKQLLANVNQARDDWNHAFHAQVLEKLKEYR